MTATSESIPALETGDAPDVSGKLRYARVFGALRKTWKSILGVSIALAICAYFVTQTVSQTVLQPHREIFSYRFPETAQWITPRGDRMAGANFRLDFRLPPAKIARAWIAVAADNGFEVTVNANPAGRWALYRATREFQNGHSEFGQRLRYEPGALRLNYPREYQWGDNKNWQMPMFLDITRYLQAGTRNTLALSAQARHSNPQIILTGEILLENGQRIPINTHAGWKACFVPPGASDREWAEVAYSAVDWPQAMQGPGHDESMWRVPPYGIFESPFKRSWHVASEGGNAVFETTWNVGDDNYDAAWLRVLSLGPYLLRINDEAIRPITGAGYHNAQGFWIAQPSGRRALALSPERVDQNEVGSAHVGENFLNPTHGDPSEDDLDNSESSLRLQADSAEKGDLHGQLESAYADKPERTSLADPLREAMATRLPKQLANRMAKPDLTGFDVSRFLRPGKNKIQIELLDRGRVFRMAGEKRFAMDAGIVRDGKLEMHLADDHPFTLDGAESRAAMQPDFNVLHQKFYRLSKNERPVHVLAAVCTFLLVGLLLAWGSWTESVSVEFLSRSISPTWSAALVLLLTQLLKLSMVERSEYLWFITNNLWQWLAIALAASVALTMTRFAWGGARFVAAEKRRSQRHQRRHHWRIALLAVLFLGLIVRFYGVDDQPLDDDEYASVQTTLNIAKTGLPEINEGIWYTRGPLYHYLAGGLIYLFGDNIWVMRAPAIFAGLAAAVFTYLLGSQVVKSQPVGVAAALIVCLNPFCIFTSHVARFYQQQQTMTIATIYFFICGFVSKSIWWKRAMAFICFGIAVLSQEISLLLIVPCAICYALMAKPESVRNELRFAAVAGLVVACIGINLVAFKVKCLTRLEGISPNIESTMSPHFSYPLNFASLFLGYSRLHLLLAPFSLLGMVVSLKKRATGMIAVTSFLLAGIFCTVLLVTGLGFRYQYSYLPLWVLASVFGVKVTADKVTRGWAPGAQKFLSAIIIAFGIASFSPWRIPESYGIRILPDSSGAVAYVRANMRDGDRVAITEPHPHCALLEAGRADYDICIPILYDFVYRNEEDGRLIDRNGGAESMGRIGTLQRAMAQHDRIWIIINREKIKNVSRNMRWEYAGTRFDYFVRQNCQVMYRAYSWDVFLWDRARGVTQSFRMEPEAWSE
ncbi:MAG: glycosyltransferase family 39 protein [Pirellulaceae bacterium]